MQKRGWIEEAAKPPHALRNATECGTAIADQIERQIGPNGAQPRSNPVEEPAQVVQIG